PIIDGIGRFRGFTGSGSDLTEKRRSVAEITRLALFDGLTGLANRQRMKLSLDKTLKQSVNPYRPTALFLMDLDRFKAVNDTLGHATGDKMLIRTAALLVAAVGAEDVVARIGGDEFAILHRLSAEEEDASALVDRIFTIAAADCAVPAIRLSIGIALSQRHAQEGDELHA
ncbi:GGDEF domain-containing protein, partial [Staphylococcus aureus]|nr:GGDEF domain-containing protein [Staphylococcus aureus]